MALTGMTLILFLCLHDCGCAVDRNMATSPTYIASYGRGKAVPPGRAVPSPTKAMASRRRFTEPGFNRAQFTAKWFRAAVLMSMVCPWAQFK